MMQGRALVLVALLGAWLTHATAADVTTTGGVLSSLAADTVTENASFEDGMSPDWSENDDLWGDQEGMDDTPSFEEELAVGDPGEGTGAPGVSGYVPSAPELERMATEVLNDPHAKVLAKSKDELRTKLGSLRDILAQTRELMKKASAPPSTGSGVGNRGLGAGLDQETSTAVEQATMALDEDDEDDSDDDSTGDDHIVQNSQVVQGGFGSDASDTSGGSVSSDVALSSGDMDEAADGAGDWNPDDAYSSFTRSEVHKAANELRAQLKPLMGEVGTNATKGAPVASAAQGGGGSAAANSTATGGQKQHDLKDQMEQSKAPMPEVPDTPITYDNASQTVDSDNWGREIGKQAKAEKALDGALTTATADPSDMVGGAGNATAGNGTASSEDAVKAEQAKEQEVALRLAAAERENARVPLAADGLRGIVSQAVGAHASDTREMVEQLEDKIATMHQDTEDATDARIDKLAQMVEKLGASRQSTAPDPKVLGHISELRQDVESLSNAFEKHQAELRKKGGGPKFMAPGNPTVAPLIDVLGTTVGIITGKPEDDREKQVDPDVNNMVKVLKKAIYHVANVTQPTAKPLQPKGVDPKSFQNIVQSSINQVAGSEIQQAILDSVRDQKAGIQKQKDALAAQLAAQKAAEAKANEEKEQERLAAEAALQHSNATAGAVPSPVTGGPATAAAPAAAAPAAPAQAQNTPECEDDVTEADVGCKSKCQCNCCQCHTKCKMALMSALMDMLEVTHQSLVHRQDSSK